jgi:zinc/manganese transport system substrate-binding protein
VSRRHGVASFAIGVLGGPARPRRRRIVRAVGAENEYANVLAQIGGKYVSVTSILNNPNTDPHTFEASPKVAEAVSGAELIVQNGVGLRHVHGQHRGGVARSEEKGHRGPARPRTKRHDTPNPHLWYSPTTMPAVARVMARDLASLQPSHRAYFRRT